MEIKHGLNEEQLGKLNDAKEWTKRNWKPFVAGAAVVGISFFVFRRRVSPIQIINVLPPISSKFA